ncbi:MAG: hypothetical protein KA436_09930 [Oligoflexales bacterium]|nr:hypothetical protein [Oligoflexales bacterium]
MKSPINFCGQDSRWRETGVRAILMFSLFSSGCKTKIVRDLSNTRVSDVVHHTIADKLGVQSSEPPPYRRDEGIMSFLNEFLADAESRRRNNGETRGIKITESSLNMLRQVKYVDVLTEGAEKGVIASCNRYYSYDQTLGGKKKIRWTTIEVLRTESEAYAEGNRRRLQELLYHEFFHCLLNKGHLPPDKEGIMSPVLNKNNPRIFTDWDRLVDELFSPEFVDLIPDVTS